MSIKEQKISSPDFLPGLLGSFAKRTSLLCAILMSVCISTQSCNASYAKEEKGVKANVPEERLEISFKFQRGGIASSQYAIWIEDEAGRLVRTLYATSFTAKGGYEYRKEALPVWVGKAKPQAMPIHTGRCHNGGHTAERPFDLPMGRDGPSRQPCPCGEIHVLCRGHAVLGEQGHLFRRIGLGRPGAGLHPCKGPVFPPILQQPGDDYRTKSEPYQSKSMNLVHTVAATYTLRGINLCI